MTLSDKQQLWLRGAYLDRITETAMNFAEGRTHFVDAEWIDYIGDEFGYLTELSDEDHAYLREQAGGVQTDCRGAFCRSGCCL